ncbi:recombinase family protein [Nonomuraea fuscirosea]|uniref:recombinase family protein n=1 Tax=Nonomuraea fuscirosea TaxID=1291556 RepID=UPI002DDC3AE5|nr:recombinase family protein [Nonomuraea fuscirosea]WSA57896.1 recombinase family protein [Nonomuraea fuscirosea]
MPKAAAIYCRLSYAPDGSVEKVERQEDDCRQLADRLAWPIDERHIYRDNSRSAWQRNRKRPGWDKLLEAIERGDVDGVLVWHGDRLMRQPWDLEKLLKLADDRSVALASPQGVRDLSSEDDRFILRIEVAQACKSSASTSRRVKRGVDAKAAKGEAWSGGKRPFGYGVPTGKKGITGKPIYDTNQAHPDEFPILREALTKLRGGLSLNGTIRWLNTVSTTTEGGRWRAVVLKKIIRSPRIAGLIDRNGTLHPAVWPAIVTLEEWEDLKGILSQNGQESHGGPGRHYLLTGIAECVSCGTGVHTKPATGRKRVGKPMKLYYCRDEECTRRVSRSVAHLDEYVIGRVLRRLQAPDLLTMVLGPEPGAAAEIVALRRRKADTKQQLRNLADHPGLDAGDVVVALASFDKRITELRSRQAATARQRLLIRMAGITRDQWDATPIDIRAETVRALYRVIILPAMRRGPGFDPASVEMIPVPISPEQADVEVEQVADADV